MSITKFVSIKNVGRFKNYNANGDVCLKPFNLVFAENGRGKSTLCAILRSTQSDDPSHVLGRTTLGASDPPHVHIVTSTGTVLFKAGKWTQAMPHLAIFDSTFIAENVFSGDAVDLDHRRNLYRVIIGKSGVVLAQVVNSLDAKVKTATSELRVKRAALEGRVPEGASFDAFLALPSNPEIDTQLAEKERELEAVQQSEQLRVRAGLTQLSVPAVPEGIVEILEQTVAGLSAQVEQRIADHIAKHGMQEREGWLQEGLGYIQDNACPFCDRPLDDVPLAAAFSAFFSEAYEQLKAAIFRLRGQVADTFSEQAIADLDRVAQNNSAAVEFWSRYVALPVLSLSSPQGTGRPIRELRNALFVLLDKKAATPLEVVRTDQRLSNAGHVVNSLRASATEYNTTVDKANALISAKKTTLAATNTQTVQLELRRLRAVKARYTPDTINACSAYTAAKKQKEEFEAQKEAARQKLDDYTKTIIGKYEKTINKLLSDFQAGFRITGTKHAYPGGVPSSTFQILINDTPVDLGDGKTPLSKASFRNTLSSGDKNTLALAFFLAELEHDPDKAGKIVVFDDPFNSQDAFRKDHTIRKIRECGTDCLQVIVLSHDQGFLKRLYDRLRAEGLDQKCLHLSRIGHSSTVITVWDIEEATQAEFRADLKTLASFYNANEGAPRTVVGRLRPVLESFCRNLYPTQFDEDDPLGVICGKIRAAGPSHGLAAECNDLDEINFYTRRYHHGENANAATEPLSDTELQGFVGKALAIMGCSL